MVQRIFFIAYLCKEIFLEISILSELTRCFPDRFTEKTCEKEFIRSYSRFLFVSSQTIIKKSPFYVLCFRVNTILRVRFSNL